MVKQDIKINDIIVECQQYLYDTIENNSDDFKQMQNIYLNSMFITKNAKEIVSKLVTIFEGENYSCMDINYKNKYYPPERVLLIRKGNYDRPCPAEWTGAYEWEYDDYSDPVKDMIKAGDSFVLARTNYTFAGGVIEIYSRYGYSDIDYGRFTYVKEFFDFVIGYRLKNGKTKEEIHEELPKLLSIFAKNNKELIEKNYHKKNLDRVREYKLFLREEKQKIGKQIDEAIGELETKVYTKVRTEDNSSKLD